MFSNGYGLLGTDHDVRNHITGLDRIIETPKLLKSSTGCTPGQFAFKLKWFEPLAMKYGPLFRGDGQRANNPRNRCKMYPRHVLLLALIRYYTRMAEAPCSHGSAWTSPACRNIEAWPPTCWSA